MVYRDSTLAQDYLDAGPFESPDAFFDWLVEADRDPLAAGDVYNRPQDPEGVARYLWVIEADSSGWIQTPRGEGFLVDPFVMWLIGDEAGHRIGLDTLRVDGVGYGWEDGRLFVSLDQSAPIVWALGGLGGLLLGGVASIWWLVVRLRQATEHGRQLTDSRRRLADSREAERLRLSRELHDGPLQDLQAARMQLGVAERAGGWTARPGIDEAYDAVQADMLRVIAELREISEGLRPPVLGSFGLAAAVRALIERLRTAHPDIRLDLQFADEGMSLTDGVRLALYRVVQESLNNAIHHGRPKSVQVRYAVAADGVRLTIEDDGVGMIVPDDLHTFERDGHLGLAGMAERAESIGGTLHVSSSPGHTCVRAHVPQTALISHD